MSLTVLTLEDREQWDVIVRSFKDYDTYWLSGYVKAFSIHGDGEPLLFYYEGDSVRGANVVMRRDIAMDDRFREFISEKEFFDFVTPYGYGGWLIEGEETTDLFSSYCEWARKHHIVSEFVRFHPIIENHCASSAFYDVIELGEVVQMDLSSPDTIWNNIISKNRNMIRKARKNDIRIYNGRYPEIIRSFVDLYNKTMDRDNAENYYYFSDDFYESILEDLPYNAQVFYAVKDGIVIAAAIMLGANKMMNYHLSGGLTEYRSFAPTNLLLYEAALWGYSNGYKSLYLGGGIGSGEDNLFKFKKSFNKNSFKRFYVGKKIFDKEEYTTLLDIRGKVESSFFPEYRG